MDARRRGGDGTMTSATLTSIDDLIAEGLVPRAARESLAPVGELYAIGLNETMAALIDRNDPADPIARQFIPDAAELVTTPEELADPIGDTPMSPVEGIVHRYPDRVLLKLLHVCPVYCRFCFRRESVGPGGATHLSSDALDKAFAYIAAHDEIFEVILTGGDPLILSLRRLEDIFTRLREIAHVKVVRIHTRVPVVAPELVSDALVELLCRSGKTVYVALHANHARELTDTAKVACAKLIEAGIPMLSQSVLLRGVNDDVETLAALMRAFVATRIKPYYLHHPDLARGTSHFRLSVAEGQKLVEGLRGKLSGLCQPRYMLDIPGGFGKVALDGSAPDEDERYHLRDFRGGTHLYPPAT
jgi:lysine 2,3-aminomutase